MLGYVIRRLIAMAPILFGISILVFAAARVMPGNFAQAKAGQNATPEQVAEREEATNMARALGRFDGGFIARQYPQPDDIEMPPDKNQAIYQGFMRGGCR